MGGVEIVKGALEQLKVKCDVGVGRKAEKNGDLIKRPPVAATGRTCHVHIQNSLRKGQFSPGDCFPLCLLPVLIVATLNFLLLFNSVTFISHFFSPS